MGSVVALFIVLLPGSLTARTLNLKNLPKESILPTTIFHWLCPTSGVYGFFLGVSCGGAFKKLA